MGKETNKELTRERVLDYLNQKASMLSPEKYTSSDLKMMISFGKYKHNQDVTYESLEGRLRSVGLPIRRILLDTFHTILVKEFEIQVKVSQNMQTETIVNGTKVYGNKIQYYY